MEVRYTRIGVGGGAKAQRRLENKTPLKRPRERVLGNHKNMSVPDRHSKSPSQGCPAMQEKTILDTI